MPKKLLKYEFWDKERKFYHATFRHVNQRDLRVIREYIAKTLSSIKTSGGSWLDIGTGDGTTLFDIIKRFRRLKKTLKINLTVIEPSKFALPLLRKKLTRLSDVYLRIINHELSLRDFPKEKFDCITFLHSNYYLGASALDYLRIYKQAYHALRPGGVLLVQSISNYSDFQKLGMPDYSKWSLGDNTYELFKKNWSGAKFKKFSTIYNATPFLTNKPSKILHFYRFVTQTHKTAFRENEMQYFQDRIRLLAKKNGKKYILNFKDCVNYVRK